MNLQFKQRFLIIAWSLLFIINFVLLGKISYVSLVVLLLISTIIFVFERIQDVSKNPLLPSLFLFLTIFTHLPLFVPAYVIIEKGGFYATYQDGSSGYAADNENHCLNCQTPEFSPLSRDQRIFITGYIYDLNFGGDRKEIITPMGPFIYRTESTNISLTIPYVLTETFFKIQSLLNILLFPLLFF